MENLTQRQAGVAGCGLGWNRTHNHRRSPIGGQGCGTGDTAEIALDLLALHKIAARRVNTARSDPKLALQMLSLLVATSAFTGHIAAWAPTVFSGD